MSKIKIAISGIGAVGGYYGGLLAGRYKNSEEVDIFFISRGENLQAIKENGLQVKNTFQTVTVHPTLATDKPEEIGPVDYLFCCTKSYDLEESMIQLAPVIGPNTVIIPLLNGADITERIQKVLPDTEVWKGCVYIGARLTEPGKVEKYTLKDRLFFGSKQGSKERQKELLSILSNARVLTTNPDDIDTEIWKKFFMISTTATITSYFNENISEVIENHKDMFITLGFELKSVIEALGVTLPADLPFTSMDSQRMMPNFATTSMHSDYQNGKNTEIESLTGYVVKMAEKFNIEIPTYQFMYKGLTEFPYPNNKRD